MVMQTVVSKDELVRVAKGETGTVDADESRTLYDQGATFLYVREPYEWENGTVDSAIKISRGMLEFKIDDLVDDQESRIVTYCSSGGRSALAAARLKEMGYAGAISSDAGFDDLKEAGISFTSDYILAAEKL